MKHNGTKPDRKLFGNSFLSARNAVEPRRSVISSEVEKSPVKKFPIGKKHCGITQDRKLFAKSFLLIRNAVEPSRIGNYSQIVSY